MAIDVFQDDFSDFLSVRVLSLRQLFHESGPFRLPWKQRAYAWQTDHATRLVHDLIGAFTADRHNYFLGYISVARSSDTDVFDLIDGQQRLVTLTLLFAHLRDLLRAGAPASAEGLETSAALDRAIWHHANRNGDVPVVSLQAHVQPYFGKSVQRLGATLEETACAVDGEWMAACEHQIADNLAAIRETISEELPPHALQPFVRFLLRRCAVVLQTVASDQDAWEIMATEEETGLSFHSSERSKVTLISAMPRADQDAASAIWADWQNRIGPEGMARLLAHLRMMAIGPRRKGQPINPLENDLLESYAIHQNGLAFVQDVLAPHAEAMGLIAERSAPGAPEPDKLARSFERLSWLPFDEWMAPALAFLRVNGFAAPQAVIFFQALDRLAWMMMLAGFDTTRRERLCAQIVGEVVSGQVLQAGSSLQPTDAQVAAALTVLRSRTFYQKRTARILVMRRLAAATGGDPGMLDGRRVTCEHVLPRNPPKTSDWQAAFAANGGHKHFADRLGNLVLLSSLDNQAVGTLHWHEKQPVLAQCAYDLSRKAAQWPEWTPETIMQRSEEMIDSLMRDLEATGEARP